MLPTAAVLLMLIAVASCCVYISYRVGQGISPTSRLIQRRLEGVEAAIVQSETSVRETLERNREDNDKQARQLMEGFAEVSEANVGLLRRRVEELSERLNGVRVDFSRDTRDLRDDVQDARKSLQEGAREDFGQLARMQGETLEKISGQIRELGGEDERRHASGQSSLERIGSDLRDAYVTSVKELREVLAVHLTEVAATVAHITERIAQQGAHFDGASQIVTAALQDGGRKQDALNGAVERQLVALRADASKELAKLLETGEKHEQTWRGLKDDFDATAQSLMRITRAVEVLRNQLTVTLHDSGGPIEVGALLEQSLQPDEFARDVEIEPGTQERVAIAVRLSDNPATQVWLPIDVLSAIDGYHELVVATVYDEAERTNDSLKTFERAIIAAAQDLSTKFVCPPHTMNLAILFVAADDLFAEVVRRHALVETLRRDLHVMVAGPATLPSLVTGLRLVLRGTRPSPRNASNGRVANNSVRSRLDS